MIRVTNLTLYMTQGDTGEIVFTPEDLGLTITETDKLLFLLTDKNKIPVRRLILSPNEQLAFTVVLTDTEDIAVGEYLWQVRRYTNAVEDEEGNLTGDRIDTPFGPSIFKVSEVLGNGQLYS